MTIKEKFEGKRGYSTQLFKFRQQRFEFESHEDNRVRNAIQILDTKEVFEVVEELLEIIHNSSASIETNAKGVVVCFGSFIDDEAVFRDIYWLSFQLDFGQDVLLIRSEHWLRDKTAHGTIRFPEGVPAKVPFSMTTFRDKLEFSVMEALFELGFPKEKINISDRKESEAGNGV